MNEFLLVAAIFFGACVFFVTRLAVNLSPHRDPLFLARVERYLPRISRESAVRREKLARLGRQILRLNQPPKAFRDLFRGRDFNRQLRYAGLSHHLNADDFLAIKWMALMSSVAAVVLLFVWFGIKFWGFWIVAPLVLAAGLGGADGWLNWRIQGRRRQINKDLPNLIDLLSLSIEAGMGLEPALRNIGENYRGPVGDEIRMLLRNLDRGYSMRLALQSLVQDNDLTPLQIFGSSVIQSQELGTSLASTLRIQSDLMRTLRRQKAEEQGQQAPVKLAFPLVGCILPALLIIFLGPPLLHFILGK